MSDEQRSVTARHIDLMHDAPPAWTQSESVASWVERQQLPEGLRRRGLESLARTLLVTLWWHFIDDVGVGLSVHETLKDRQVRVGRVFFWEIDPHGHVEACHVDPNCGPRWYVCNVIQPLRPRMWVERVLHHEHRLKDCLEITLVECGWKHYPDSQLEYDPDAASQVSAEIWGWCTDRIVRRVHHARFDVPVQRKLVAAFRLDRDLIAMALRARPHRRSVHTLTSSFWNRCVEFTTTLKALADHQPDAMLAFGAFIDSGTTESSRVIADMLERKVTEAKLRSPNQ